MYAVHTLAYFVVVYCKSILFISFNYAFISVAALTNMGKISAIDVERCSLFHIKEPKAICFFLWYINDSACHHQPTLGPQIARFMGPTRGPPGSCRPQMGPMLAPWTLLSGTISHRWGQLIALNLVSLQWRHNGCDRVSNHQPQHCLLNGLFRRRSKKASKLRATGLCGGIHLSLVNSPHKWPVTRKMFPFDDVIMLWHIATDPI